MTICFSEKNGDTFYMEYYPKINLEKLLWNDCYSSFAIVTAVSVILNIKIFQDFCFENRFISVRHVSTEIA